MTARFRIVGTELPGLACGPSPTETGLYQNIHVGIQRGREVVSLVRGDAPQAIFEFDVTTKDGRFTGPYIHGRDDQRFIYLSWGEVTDGEFRMFRRAKLQLDHLDATKAEGRVVHGALVLTDARGHPICASLRRPQLSWTVH